MYRRSVFRSIATLLTAALICAGSSCRTGPISNVRTNDDPGPASHNQDTQEQAQTFLPPATGFVNDFANVFSPESRKELETVLTELKDRSAIEFAVVTVETTGGIPIFDYSLALARGWGVGPEDTSKGGGLLLVLAVKERQWRIQVSESLEKDLPDEVCKELGDRSVDLYRQERYSEGLTKYVMAIIERLEGVRKFKVGHSIRIESK